MMAWMSREAIASNIDRVYAEGGHIESENWTVASAKVLQLSDRRTVLSLAADIDPEVTVAADGKRKTREGGRQPMTMVLSRTGSKPVVEQLDVVT